MMFPIWCPSSQRVSQSGSYDTAFGRVGVRIVESHSGEAADEVAVAGADGTSITNEFEVDGQPGGSLLGVQ